MHCTERAGAANMVTHTVCLFVIATLIVNTRSVQFIALKICVCELCLFYCVCVCLV